MSQTREQVASKDFILIEKETDLANRERELAARAAEIFWKQEELVGSAESVPRPE